MGTVSAWPAPSATSTVGTAGPPGLPAPLPVAPGQPRLAWDLRPSGKEGCGESTGQHPPWEVPPTPGNTLHLQPSLQQSAPPRPGRDTEAQKAERTGSRSPEGTEQRSEPKNQATMQETRR